MKARLLLPLILLAGLTSCFPEAIELPTPEGADLPGFFSGLWHGLIMPLLFIVSLLDDQVAIYETMNVGGWYDLGYLIGLSSSLGGGGFFGSSRARRRYRD